MLGSSKGKVTSRKVQVKRKFFLVRAIAIGYYIIVWRRHVTYSMWYSCSLFRGIPTHRGWVKKIRFAPGKGNQKLLVMYTDGAEVWDTKEVRSQRDWS